MTPTNEAGHGLPELPEPLISGGNDKSRPDLGRGCTGYTADQVQQYAKDYAAALALSRGVPADMVLVPREMPDALAESREYVDGEFSRSNYETIYRLLAAAPAAAGAQGEEYQRGYAQGVADTQKSPKYDSTGDTVYTQPAAADWGVRERARELLAREVDADAAATPGLSIEAERIRNGKTDSAFVDAALRAVSAALSSRRQAGDDLSKFRELAERWRDGLKDEDEITAMAHGKFVDELLALVEKGAG